MIGSSQIHTQTFSIAEIAIQIKSELPFTQQTFAPKFSHFQISQPGKDKIILHYHFVLPDLPELGEPVFHQPPWAIYQHPEHWNYLGIAPDPEDHSLWCLAEFNREHTIGHIYSPNAEQFLRGNLYSLTTFPTDQILLAPVLADRKGCYLHAAGMVINGQGLLFVGHSGAGKSTLLKLLWDEGEILCDDRIIVRRWPDGFRVHGTWSHGEIPVVSNTAAPLRALLLLEQAPVNRLIPIKERGQVVRTLPFFVIKPLVTVGWWEQTLDLVGNIAKEVPIYRLQFQESAQVQDLILDLVAQKP